MNSHSDLRLSGTMLLVATLICGGFAVAALYPVVKQTTWREIISPTTVSSVSPDGTAQEVSHDSRVHQRTSTAPQSQNQQQNLAQTRRRAEEDLIRKRAAQEQAQQRYAARQAQPSSHSQEDRTVSVSANGERTTHTIPRLATQGSVQDHAVADGQRNEVYVPVNVHPVTVNVEGSGAKDEFARLADGINQVLMAQREALRIQQQPIQQAMQPPQPPQPPIIINTVPQTVAPPAAVASRTEQNTGFAEKERLQRIDATLRELFASFETLRSDTRSAVAGISSNVTQAQASQTEQTKQLMADYRRALEQQEQLQLLLKRHEEDIEHRRKLEQLAISNAAPVVVPVAVPRPTAAITIPEPASVPAPAPVVSPKPVAPAAPLADTAAQPEESPEFEDFEVVEGTLEDHSADGEWPQNDEPEFDEPESVSEEQTSVVVATETSGPWDLENPPIETDSDPEFERWIEAAWRPEYSVQVARAERDLNREEQINRAVYEQTYQFPTAERRRQFVRTAEVRPADSRIQRQPQTRRPGQADQSSSSGRPAAFQRLAPLAPRPSGVIAEFGHNLRQGANQMVNGVSGNNARLKNSAQDAKTESFFMHRMKSAFRGVGSSRTVK